MELKYNNSKKLKLIKMH